MNFAESQLFIEYTKYITLLAPTINGNPYYKELWIAIKLFNINNFLWTKISIMFKGGLNANRDQNEDAQHLKKYKERIAKEVEDIKQKELDQVVSSLNSLLIFQFNPILILFLKLREEKAKLVDETKVRIKQLEDIIVEETKTKAQLVEKNKILETGICFVNSENLIWWIYIFAISKINILVNYFLN